MVKDAVTAVGVSRQALSCWARLDDETPPAERLDDMLHAAADAVTGWA
jgi:hypothetical protein